jgi:hypothetical protein
MILVISVRILDELINYCLKLNILKLEGTQKLHTSARYSEVKRNLGIS